ncbi:DUF4351 domain-containing protein, partial [Serpentinimonas barnesii]|uniref:DUF4351 domain-containing protein n=1 Tax=Serpentinimonas barnesii TaxID=1458427 RepID=UPI0004966908
IEWLRHRSGHTLPQLSELAQSDNLLEITHMLETNIKRLIKRAAAEAMAEGKLEGEAALLERQLARRFGPITPSTRARLDSATAMQLEAWADRILDARTLAEVFVDH